MRGYIHMSRAIRALSSVRILKVLWYILITFFATFLILGICGRLFGSLLMFFILLALLYYGQNNFLFYPDHPAHSREFIENPSMYNMPYENILIYAPDKTLLHLYFIHQPKDRQRQSPTIIYFHGNAGNMGHRLKNCEGLYYSLNCNILLVEYRGYGLSAGSPSENGLYMDARTSLDYLFSRKDINHSEIIIFGRSLGAAVAIDLCAQKEYASKVWCLVLENTFTSIPEMVKVLLGGRLLQYLPVACYKNKFLSIDKISFVCVPTLFISGMADTLVPPKMMLELYDRCGSSQKQLLKIRTGAHNTTWSHPGYYHSLALFLQNCRLQRQTVVSNNYNSEHNKKVLLSDDDKNWGDIQHV